MMMGSSRPWLMRLVRTLRWWLLVGLVIALGAGALQTRAQTQADEVRAGSVFNRDFKDVPDFAVVNSGSGVPRYLRANNFLSSSTARHRYQLATLR